MTKIKITRDWLMLQTEFRSYKVRLSEQQNSEQRVRAVFHPKGQVRQQCVYLFTISRKTVFQEAKQTCQVLITCSGSMKGL